ncbi:MAG: Hypothetical protein BHV28_07830 [Candidatus Tokpelaia hoelldobleri]|uniref:Uncharacterized protein n=1 Tax=Candidatus Tokpelaia hoelldobleri TaxID=1902579 RepID=A0A1U9JUF5_9HYPH|nr:MAG: Hypothetical protein BHV28_07830 [Candidatus Tokpelaia hoelldoblerii]
MKKDQDKNILQRVEAIERSVKELKLDLDKTTEIAESKIVIDEVSAKQTLDNATDLLKDAEERSQKAADVLKKINEILEEVKESINMYKNNKTLINNSIKKAESLNQKCESLNANEEQLKASQSEVHDLQEQANASLLAAQKVAVEIEGFKTDSGNTSAKINDLLNKSANFKERIENLHDKIMGYEYKDEETGENKHESGLKDELENSYKTLSASIANQEKEARQFVKSTEDKLEKLKEIYDEEFRGKKERIDELLPGALTAGLSAAYAEKTKAEGEQLNSYKKSFKYAIFCLVGISMMPLFFNLNLYYFHDYDFVKIINSLPETLTFSLPLYLPFFWMAWNANKEMKLSKRLIEEYTHKEVLSRTYQGLSEQVKDLEGDGMSLQLKARLLYNLISTSSENPGKLISDYNKSDNLLLEILDRSIALSDSVKKFEHMPFLGKIFAYLGEKEQKKVKEAEEKVENGVDTQTFLEDNKLN